MHSILHHIIKAQRSIAILLDPEKIEIDQLIDVVSHCEQQFESWKKEFSMEFCCFFIGGSTMNMNMDEWLDSFKKITDIPIVIFPGSHEQLSENADGLLFLNLVSGRNPEYLIEQQVRAAQQLKNTTLEVIPTGYLLIDGKVKSAVQQQSQTVPMSQDDIAAIIDTAYAAQLMGNQLVYLEAGSGAQQSVAPKIVKAVADQLTIPVIVGGGLRRNHQIENTFNAGATMVVVGTAVENNIL